MTDSACCTDTSQLGSRPPRSQRRTTSPRSRYGDPIRSGSRSRKRDAVAPAPGAQVLGMVLSMSGENLLACRSVGGSETTTQALSAC